jgi:hypothetical protein
MPHAYTHCPPNRGKATISGTALATLSNGRTVPFQIKGKYSAGTGQSKLRLTGIGNGIGSRLSLVTNGDMTSILTISGLMLGQTIR